MTRLGTGRGGEALDSEGCGRRMWKGGTELWEVADCRRSFRTSGAGTEPWNFVGWFDGGALLEIGAVARKIRSEDVPQSDVSL